MDAKLEGSSTTLDTYPASKPTANKGAKYLLSALELKTATFAPSCFAACSITAAYCFALKLLSDHLLHLEP